MAQGVGYPVGKGWSEVWVRRTWPAPEHGVAEVVVMAAGGRGPPRLGRGCGGDEEGELKTK